MTKDDIIRYWVSSSDKDLKVMGSLFKNGHYGWSLLRYPDYKSRFYKKANKKFAEDYVTKIKDFRKWLKKKVKEQSTIRLKNI